MFRQHRFSVGLFVLGGLLYGGISAAQNSNTANTPYTPKVPTSAPGAIIPVIPERFARDFQKVETKEQTIREALDKPIEPWDFESNSLLEIIEFLTSTREFPILIDQRAFADEGYDAESMEFTINLSNITLRSALKLLFENSANYDLAWVIEDEVMKITTRVAADETLTVEVYNINGFPTQDVSEIERLLVAATPGPWYEEDDDGGTLADVGNEFLVVRQNRKNHEAIVHLLRQFVGHAQ